ncbi:putative NAD(P)/FAD-binding protein YdhS [Actinocorallia herbida]|uniref:Putative NAD(P)/FAD-binding protein YdhS n=1 Tax=Actinocorallia herbida TaxID=58109 RepID=A0A3N1DCE1_9ACTN|nr:FAD/NAD(P)-binding protein [Actinocorallia herbida]ROO90798.1 putative NAD(P)/FAD-binding protein YdhS [Actinocorallia herbida]
MSVRGRTAAPAVVIVGGGASAALTAIHLLLGEREAEPPRVVIVDREGRHGLGQAYSTTDPTHLLNAPVAKMSALAEDPDHLLRWARAQGITVEGSDFLPRRTYGRYLRDLLDEAGRLRPGRLTEITGTVTSVSPEGSRWKVAVDDGDLFDADAVVLATGNRAPTAWPWEPEGDPRYIADPWAPGALDRVDDSGDVLVVGTGLTMVDLAMTLTSRHPDRVVYAVSRHGLLPRPHRCPAPPAVPFSPPAGDVTVADLHRIYHESVERNDGEWRGVVDGLRPHVPEMWGRLSLPEKQRFLTFFARGWEVRRHRIPPVSVARIDDLRSTGRLRVVKGFLDDVTAGRDSLAVAVATDGLRREFEVGWVVNSTGPAADPRTDPLLRDLIDAGTIAADPLGLGLSADGCGCLLGPEGEPRPGLFTLGPTLRGLRYETTAVPEIRAQAAHLAAVHLAEYDVPAARPSTGRAVTT